MRRWLSVAALAVVVAVLWRLAPQLREFTHMAVDSLRQMGPVVFFAAMAVLPSFGCPLLPFSIAAGPIFSPQLGTPLVVICAVGAVAVNVSLSYAMARLLKPLAVRALNRCGWSLPRVTEPVSWRWVLMVRLAPGLPFFVQSYTLGAMEARVWPYLVISTLVPAGYIGGTIVLGESLWNAEARTAYFATGVLIFIALVLHWLKSRSRRTPPPNEVSPEENTLAP